MHALRVNKILYTSGLEFKFHLKCIISCHCMIIGVHICRELVTDSNAETLADKFSNYGVTIPQHKKALQQKEIVISS